MVHWRERLKEACATWLPGTRPERWIFGALVLLAAVLRMWDLPHIPFMHDEISALVRLYPTLRETLLKGVTEQDTHPPGVQLFEWLWTRAFGSDEAVIKLPFILMSVASLFFIYRFACAWTNATVALITTALMATLQYFVLYGQIARPYAFGLFTTAVMADRLTRYMANGRMRDLLWSMLAAVFSAYAHHFALMQAVLIGGTGLALISREQRRSFLVVCAIAVLAYVPNVPIFLHQLSQGGLNDWLQPPDRYWLGDYAWWIAHCSWLMAAVLIALLVFSLIGRIQAGRSHGPFVWIALLWGLVPLIVGYSYSVWRAPVLQYSVLIFSFPYLLILLLSGIRPLSRKPMAGMAIGAAAVSVFTLITVRLHYQLFYRSKYEAFIRDGMKAQATYGKEDCLVLLDAPDHVIRFYMERWGITETEFPYLQLRDHALPVDAVHTHAFIGASNGARVENVILTELMFQTLIERRDFCDGQSLLLTRKDAAPPGDLELFSAFLPGHAVEHWSVAGDVTPVMDSLTGRSDWDHSGREFGIEFKVPADSIVQDVNDQIVMAAIVHGTGPAKAHLIAQLDSGSTTVFYRGDDLVSDTIGDLDRWLVVALSPADGQHRDTPLRLKAYIWNEGRGHLTVSGMLAFTRVGNPVQYAYYGPITNTWVYR